ncbi:F-box/LRR-repeat protein 8-like [Liolophura sinensis]|uniref:F-box/LRR-repeat protein 8-like n=1 Tax=Liolophura sinensis TaxID=3198878 RepID=UPI00315934BC
MATETKCWSSLPEHIIVHIFSYLPLSAKYKASMVCSFWNQCFKSQYLWQRFCFQFFVPADTRYLHCVKRFGQYLRHVSIDLDQSDEENRENACAVIHCLARETDKRRVNSIRVRFRGENPLFYAGAEFIANLKILFGPPPETVQPLSQIRCVDLSGLMAALSEEVLDLLSTHNPELERLNIQNKTLVCNIFPECMVRVTRRCQGLKDLRLYHFSCSEEVLLSFTEEGRTPLEHLAITCRREEKYGKDLSSAAWSSLVKKLPDLRVTLGFDPTCPLHKVSTIMKPEIPVSVMLLETYTRIFDEVNLVTDYYQDKLEKIVINTRTSPEFEAALVKMSRLCTNLHIMKVYNCVLPVKVVEEILRNRSEMCARGSYSFQSDSMPDWAVVGVESGD